VLIASSRYSAADAERWRFLERQDDLVAKSLRHARHVARSEAWIRGFVREDANGYAGVSWGKDSVVVADMIARIAPSMPLVWVRVDPIANPDCVIVRDAFLRAHVGVTYDEIIVTCARDARGWHATGTLERGFAEAASRHGRRHMSGVRAEESGARKRRMRTNGETTRDTCAPIGWWKAEDVFAYLYARQLPVHPAYACGISGVWTRDRIRVASLGGKRGTGHGRSEWERTYYADAIRTKPA
jgi:phosphoadenosine phosphosulfate reductase